MFFSIYYGIVNADVQPVVPGAEDVGPHPPESVWRDDFL